MVGDRLRVAARFLRRLLAPVPLSIAVLVNATGAGPVSAATWRIQPTVSLSETYTDNVRLGAKGTESSDLITQVTPGIVASATGARFRLNANYGLQQRLYASTTSANGGSHQLSASSTAEILQRSLFVDASASIAQANSSALGAAAVDNTSVTGNRTEISQIQVSPRYLGRIGDYANYQAQYSLAGVKTSGGAVSNDSQLHLASVRVNSGPSFSRIGWGAVVTQQKVDSATAPDTDLGSVSLTGRFRVNPQFVVTGSAGYDHNSSGAANSNGASRIVGFEWVPGPRTRVGASFGERSFGTTKGLNASHRTALGTWNVSYAEEVTTSAQQLANGGPLTADLVNQVLASRIPDPVERAKAAADFVAQQNLPGQLPTSVNFLTNRLFLQKTLSASVGLDFRTSTVFLSAYQTLRESLSTTAVPGLGDFANGATSDQKGGSLTLNHRLGPLTRANAILSVNRVTSGATENTDYSYRVQLSHQIQPKVDGNVDLRHLRRASTAVASEYQENAVTASVRVRF
jgi:uncharacterized protein (PEP-CTERM system associated)